MVMYTRTRREPSFASARGTLGDAITSKKLIGKGERTISRVQVLYRKVTGSFLEVRLRIRSITRNRDCAADDRSI